MAAAVVTLSASARELLAHAPLVAVGRYSQGGIYAQADLSRRHVRVARLGPGPGARRDTTGQHHDAALATFAPLPRGGDGRSAPRGPHQATCGAAASPESGPHGPLRPGLPQACGGTLGRNQARIGEPLHHRLDLFRRFTAGHNSCIATRRLVSSVPSLAGSNVTTPGDRWPVRSR